MLNSQIQFIQIERKLTSKTKPVVLILINLCNLFLYGVIFIITTLQNKQLYGDTEIVEHF